MQRFSGQAVARNGILLPKLFWPTVRKNCSSDREKLLKFEAEGREFAKGPGAKKATRKSPGYFNQILTFESRKWF